MRVNASAGALLLLLAGGLAGAQMPANGPPRPAVSLSLQDLTPTGEPFGWYVDSGAGDALSLQVQPDPATGLPRWVLRNSTPSSTTVYTRSDSSRACFHSIRIAAEARTEDSGEVRGLLAVSTDGRSRLGPITPLTRRWVDVRHEWRSPRCLPGAATVGFMLRGHVELRRMHILLDGQPELIPTLRRVDWAELADLRRIAAAPAAPERTAHLAALLRRPVLGLGTSGHGASAAFELKFSLLRHLEEAGRLHTLAVELPAAAGAVVDRYIRGASDDRQEMLGALAHPLGPTREAVALVDWLRRANGQRAQAIRFTGLAPRGSESPASERAEGLLRLARDLAEGEQLVLWSDNGQIARAPGQLGALLTGRLGEDYGAIAVTFAQGAYGIDRGESTHPVQLPYPGTHEHILSSTGMNRFLLALRDLPEQHPLRERRGLRRLGGWAQPFDQFLATALDQHFDAVAFVRHTEPTHLLRPSGAP